MPDPGLLERALLDAESAGQRPSSLVLTLPDNPTGTLAPLELVRRMREVAERHDLLIISDEIYRTWPPVPCAAWPKASRNAPR